MSQDAQKAHEAAEQLFWAIRGRAIQAYAGLEQALFGVFRQCLGTDRQAAAIVFFKITNSQARNKIVEKLIRYKHGDKYNLFWNSFLQQLRPLDIKRNEIVHWNGVRIITDTSDRTELVPPGFWGQSEFPSISVDDLRAFIDKIHVFEAVCSMFEFIASGDEQLTEEKRRPLREIFDRPLIYPLPAGHPLSPKPKAPSPPPQSSGA